MSPEFQAAIDAYIAEYHAGLAEMGLTTPGLIGRYNFWRAMGNAHPRLQRWGCDLGVSLMPVRCDPEPWRA